MSEKKIESEKIMNDTTDKPAFDWAKFHADRDKKLRKIEERRSKKPQNSHPRQEVILQKIVEPEIEIPVKKESSKKMAWLKKGLILSVPFGLVLLWLRWRNYDEK